MRWQQVPLEGASNKPSWLSAGTLKYGYRARLWNSIGRSLRSGSSATRRRVVDSLAVVFTAEIATGTTAVFAFGSVLPGRLLFRSSGQSWRQDQPLAISPPSHGERRTETHAMNSESEACLGK